jgi:hypothetical protein
MSRMIFSFGRSHVARDAERLALLTAEYESLRVESMESFRTAQSIIQWTLATYGVLFGAGFIALQANVTPAFRVVSDFGAILIFAALPGFVTAATWQWLGEITRMERVGAYLRGFEEALVPRSGPVRAWPRSLAWETFLGGTAKASGNKRKIPYVGTACMFAGILIAPIWLSAHAQTAFLAAHPDWIWIQPGFWVWDIGIAVVFFAVSLRLGFAVQKLGGQRYDIEREELVDVREGRD